jgi:beta-lactamase superfamily II metal-dependent hydrolase
MGRVGVALGLLAVLPVGARPARRPELIDPLRVTFFPLQRGEATLVQAPGGKNILVGGGAPGEGRTVVRMLAARGIRKLDIAVVQTWKDRHLGGLPAVMGKFGPPLILTNSRYAGTEHGIEISSYADYTTRTNKAYMRSPGVGESTSLFYNPVCRMTAVSPLGTMLAEKGEDPDCSMVLEFTREKTAFLSLGDTTQKLQKQIWAGTEDKPWGQILQIGRNGAADALLPQLLKPLKTRIAVIPVATKRPAPAPSLLATLKKAGVTVYRTDRNGAITVTTDGQSYQVTTER